MCLLIRTVSQVSDVAHMHGPFVYKPPTLGNVWLSYFGGIMMAFDRKIEMAVSQTERQHVPVVSEIPLLPRER